MTSTIVKHLSSLLLIVVMMVTASACRDDLFDSFAPAAEGTGEIRALIDFSDVVHPVTSRSRAAGDAIENINSLCVFLYRLQEGAGDDGSDIFTLYHRQEVELSPADGLGSSKVEFNLPGIDFGVYRIYAVANMPELADDELYSDEEIFTPDKLRDVKLTWDPSSAGANNQMFGYFTTLSNQHSDGFEGENITISSLKTELHAWLKRAASKVTVAIDGSKLNPGVKVWIKSIRLREIPSICWLGRTNTPDRANLTSMGESITVADDPASPDGDDAPNLVSREGSYPRVIDEAHTPDAEALFFYENMQGDGQLKAQVWPDQGENPDSPKYPFGNSLGDPGYKDGKIAGTYVEVVGFYENESGSGPIIYRFMLGKNTTDNYDAERNFHYQLTLRLQGNANNSDWHIVYDQEPDLIGITPGYISYLYNQKMTYDFKVVGGDLIDLYAEIPVNDKTKRSWAPKDGEVTPEDEAAAASVGGTVYYTGEVAAPGPWDGFLSLREPRGIIYGTVEEGFGANDARTYSLNRKKFYGLSDQYFSSNAPDLSDEVLHNDKVYNLGFRRYDVAEGTHGDEDGGRYTVNKTAPGEWEVFVPLFTRQLVMTAQTGYTGVNPYVAYNRLSEVNFTARIRRRTGEEVEVTKTFEVIQSRRVVNPKGIWREGNSPKPFHVKLMILPYETSPKFETFPSDGPWRAEVAKGQGWIRLIPTAGVSQANADGSVSGTGDPYDKNNPGSTIDFTVDFNGTTSSPRGGIIYVYYNNYSCVHTIFVRQGYDPIEFKSCPGVMWHSFNLLSGGDDTTAALEVDGPEEEGSYFRLHNRAFPISAQSCYAPDPFKVVNRAGTDFDIVGPDGRISEQKKWPDITLDPMPQDWGKFIVDIDGEPTECRLPSREDWHKIIDDHNTIYGFGVVYADCADETAEYVDQVYGISRHHDGHGMRGVVICDASDGHQIFLPIAACGYGRFKQDSRSGVSALLPPDFLGVVQYAGRYTWYTETEWPGVERKPLFYDLFSANGSLYWLAGHDGLDINYSTLDFAINTQEDLRVVVPVGKDPDRTGTDAIHIRLVHDKK